ncbi:MAG: hypothetical protein P4L57_08650 [Rhizomicrobium sp.]|nr:hypothetical protein [Rhizomicrobium sp.]
MKGRVETMRQHRAAEAAAAAKSKAEAAAAQTDEPVDAAACARIQIRGTADDAAAETKQARWERDVRTDAAANGGMVPPYASGQGHSKAVRLFASKPLPTPADTETELNGLIAECRFLMREVAFVSACLTYDPEDRIRYMTSAQNMALTGAKVGDTVAKLRGGGEPAVETRRHELVYTHVQASQLRRSQIAASHSLPPAITAESDKQ